MPKYAYAAATDRPSHANPTSVSGWSTPGYHIAPTTNAAKLKYKFGLSHELNGLFRNISLIIGV